MNIFSKNCVLLLSALGLGVLSATPAEARLVYSTEEDGVHTPAFYLNQADTSDDFVDLNFGTSAGAQLRYDVVNDKFFLNRDLDLEASEIQDFKVERLAVAPTCDALNEGRMYFNTVAGQTYVCDGTVFNALENDGLEKFTYKGELDAGSDTLPITANVGDLYLINGAGDNFGDIEGDDDLSVGDVVFFSDQNNNGDATDTQNWIPLQRNDDDAATQAFVAAVTLEQGTQNTNIGNNAAALAALATVASSGDYNDLINLPTLGTAADNAETDFATAAQGALADSALQSGDNVSELANDAGYITTDSDTTYSAGTGLTLTGTTFSNDLGTSIDETEIDADSIQDSEMDYTAVTLADFTNDAGFVTTDNDTTYTGSGGITLTGTNFTADLGTTVETGEITDGTITFADLNSTDITLADFTNDAGFVTTDNDTTYSAGTGMNLVGTTFSTTLGTSIGIAELENGGNNQVLTTTGAGVPQWENKSNFATSAQGALADSALQSGDNVSELTNDAGYITTDSDTTYSAGTGLTLTGTTFSNDLGTDIATGELQDDAVTSAKVLDATLTADDLADDSVSDAEINYTAVTLADFTNDAGFVTTDNDTTYTGSGGITLTGTNFTADLGTTVETGEITDGTITFADLNSTDITLSDFTNDAGFLTTVDISADTNLAAGTGATLTGDTLSVDLGTSIDASEIDTNAVNDDEINYTTVTLADFTNDAGFVTTDNDTTYSAGTGITLTGTTFSNDLGTDIDDTEVDFGSVTLSDFTNDAGFVTTDNDTTYSAGTGITLTGTTFSNDLGSDIDVSEIVSAGVGDADKVLTTSVAGVPQWEVKSNFATAAQGALADSALQSGDNVSELTNDAGYITTDSDTTYSAGTGITLTGTTFSNDLGTDIATGELQDDAVTSAKVLDATLTADDLADDSVSDAEIDFANVTLTDFTNDAGFVTTDNDTTYSAGTGITLTGTTFSNDLGTTIETGEITNGTITFADLNSTDITLADFTNDAGFLTTVDISDDTNLAAGTGATLTGDTLSVDLGTSIDASEIDTNAVNDDEINYTTVTLADFTNDAGFVTTDNDTTYSAGTGITLTGTTFSNDLGSDIDVSEIVSAGVGDADKVLTTSAVGVPQWEVKSNFATSAQGALADSALQSGDNVSELTNDAGYLTSDSDTTYTAGSGLTLTGTTFSNDLGTSIDETEIDADSIQDSEMDYTAVTLSDFTNDAGFVTTDNDTTYTGSGGITLTGTNFTSDLGTTIETGEITNGTITFADLNSTDITLADFTNDAGFVTTDNDTTYSAGTGITLTGTTFSNDLGTDIDDTELDFGSVTLSDFTNDAGFVTTDNDTTYTGSGGITLTGTNFTSDLGTSISLGELENGGNNQVLTTTGAGVPQWENKSNFATSAQGALADSALQSGDNVSELTNDAGYLTSDSDTTYTAGSGLTLTGTTFSNDLGTSIDETEIDADSIQDSEMDYTAVTLADFTNDAGFVTTDNDTTYTGSGGITLTGTNFTSDLGTSIDASEIDTNAVNDDEINYTTVTLSDFTNDAGYITSDSDTTYTAGSGLTLTGTTFSNDLGTTIETGEITNGTITFADLNSTDITLADFTNDAGFVTTDNDTTYTGGTGITLTGTTFSNDLGTNIATGELQDDAVTSAKVLDATLTADDLADDSVSDAELDFANVTLADFTNDAGFITSDSDTTYTAGTGLTLTGTSFSNDLGTSISSAEIELNTIVADDIATNAVGAAELADNAVDTAAIANNAVNGTKIALGSDTAGDVMYYNGTDWTRLPVGAAGEVLQVNAGATAPEWSAGTATKYQFIDIFGCVRGSASAGTVGGGNSPVVRFDAAGNSQMRCALPVPSDWQAGTDINVEVYYSPADNTAGNVQFELKHAAYGVGETVSNGDFTDTVTGTEAISASTELDIYELIEDIPAAGLALDDMINFNLRRTPGVAADTYAGDINIHQLRISYTGKEL